MKKPRNDHSLFGFKMYIVNTDSMAATDFNAGSLILVKEVNSSTLKEGDIITFMSQDAATSYSPDHECYVGNRYLL